MSYLNKAKRNLAARATQIFTDMRSDLQFEEYEGHYTQLGITMSNIDKIETWSELLQRMMKGEFDHIGMFSSDMDEEGLEEFLEEIFGK